MAVLIDTGVLLRLFERNDPHYSEIREAIRSLRERGELIVTSVQNVAEFWNASTRPATARGGFGHPVRRVKFRVGVIERFCEVLSETTHSYDLWKQLVEHHGTIGVSVHDARIVSVMIDHGVSTIVTLNVADFRRFTEIAVVAPANV